MWKPRLDRKADRSTPIYLALAQAIAADVYWIRAVQAFGGFVDKFLGDALLALFGAPAAHEDDPERALRAALDMMRRATRVGERLDVAADVPLRLHIGINTGQVVTGGIGAGDAKSYSVTGDTVNIAQRLQGLAGFVRALADAERSEDYADVQAAVRALTLAEQARRLAGAAPQPAPEHTPELTTFWD